MKHLFSLIMLFVTSLMASAQDVDYWEPCNLCNGTGVLYSGAVSGTCFKCGGQGKHHVVIHSTNTPINNDVNTTTTTTNNSRNNNQKKEGNPRKVVSEQKQCQRCWGSGKCQTCNGRGYTTTSGVGSGTRQCAVCRGDRKCRSCGGRGYNTSTTVR